jgi:hypothetical protein
LIPSDWGTFISIAFISTYRLHFRREYSWWLCMEGVKF